MDLRLEAHIAAGAPFAAPVLVDGLTAYRDHDVDAGRELEAMGVRVPIVVDVSERLGMNILYHSRRRAPQAVEAETGARFWIFRNGDGEDDATGGQAWFLQGLFG